MLLTKVSQDIYAYLGTDDPRYGSNAGFVISPQGVAVVDCDCLYSDSLLQEIRRLTDQPVRFLINTHFHLDHISANDSFAQLGALIVSSHGTRRNAETLGEAELQERLARRSPGKASQIHLPPLTFSGELVLHLGQKELRLVDMGPGHTHGDTVVYMPQDGVLFSGDLLFAHNYPVVRAYSHANPANWVNILDRLLEWPWEMVVPGHGPLGTKKEVRELRDYFLYLMKQVQKMVRSGKSLEEVRQGLDLSAYASWGRASAVPEALEVIYRIYQRL